MFSELEMMTASILKKLSAPGNDPGSTPGNEPGSEIDPGVFQNLLAAGGAANDQFGVSVAATNTSVVIGAYGHLTKGAAYVY